MERTVKNGNRKVNKRRTTAGSSGSSSSSKAATSSKESSDDSGSCIDDDESPSTSTGTGPAATTKRPAAKQEDVNTSIKLFRKYIRRADSSSPLEASGVTSLQCFEEWKTIRKGHVANPVTAFQKALTGHLTGLDGRAPFQPEEEDAILEHLRKKQRWECFQSMDVRVGRYGFRALGYHERLRNPEGAEESSSPTTRKKPKLVQGDAIEEDRRLPSVEALLNNDDELPAPSPPSALTGPKSSRTRPEVQQPITPVSHGAPFDPSPVNDHSSPSTLASLQEWLLHAATIAIYPPSMPISLAIGTYQNFYYIASSGLKLLQQKTMDWGSTVQSIFGFVRFRLLHRGWLQTPSWDDAHEIVQEVQEKHPGDYVIVYDFTASDHRQRIMLQCDLAVFYFGGVSQQHGGFSGSRFTESEAWKVSCTVARALTYPGEPIPVSIEWKLNSSDVDEALGPVQTALFDCHFYADEQRRVVVEHGRLAKGVVIGQMPRRGPIEVRYPE